MGRGVLVNPILLLVAHSISARTFRVRHGCSWLRTCSWENSLPCSENARQSRAARTYRSGQRLSICSSTL